MHTQLQLLTAPPHHHYTLTLTRRQRSRNVFLARHLEALRPFIAEKVVKKLEGINIESPRKTRGAGAVHDDGAAGAAAAGARAGARAGVRVAAAARAGAATADDDDDDDEVAGSKPGCKISDTQLQDLLQECELRDYQCDGIRFLVEMYDRGIPAILGDEVS